MGICTILRHVEWENQQNKFCSVIIQVTLPSNKKLSVHEAEGACMEFFSQHMAPLPYKQF